MLHAKQLFGNLGILLAILGDSGKPGIAQILAALANPLAEVIVDAIGHVELPVFRPAIIPFRETNLVFPERLPVGAAGVLLVGRAVTDVAVDDDQRRAVIGVLESSEGTREHFQVICITYPSHIPPVADEAG